MTTATAADTAADTSAAQPAARPARFDIYAGIHRALRLFMTDTLGRIGWLDTSDEVEMKRALDQLDALLATCRNHLEHENAFVHPAIEARRPGGSRRIAGEHIEHVHAISALEAESALLRAAPSGALALRVYRHLAVFIADNFHHMQVEETAHNEMLWAAYSDDEIVGIHDRLLATLGPDEHAMVLRWMTPALPPAERAGWLGGMRQQMPPEAFAMVMDAARAALDDTAWAKLARALGLPPVPGLVTV
jgi:hypothetical protein